MELGFDKSSMRSISRRCGMTAAGIYRHCIDKEDLFNQIVFPAVARINNWLNAHIARYIDAITHEEHIQWRDSEIDMMREIIYPNMEEYHRNKYATNIAYRYKNPDKISWLSRRASPGGRRRYSSTGRSPVVDRKSVV